MNAGHSIDGFAHGCRTTGRTGRTRMQEMRHPKALAPFCESGTL
jgi:hypothetical protein